MRASTLLTRSLTSFTSIASGDTSLSELHGAARNRYLGSGETVAVLGVHGVLLGIPLPLVSLLLPLSRCSSTAMSVVRSARWTSPPGAYAMGFDCLLDHLLLNQLVNTLLLCVLD